MKITKLKRKLRRQLKKLLNVREQKAPYQIDKGLFLF